MSAALRAEQMAVEAEAHYATSPNKLFMPATGASITNWGVADVTNVGFEYADMDDAFPDVDPGVRPTGSLVLVQFRHAPLRTPGGIELDSETRRTEADNNQVAKVVAMGPLAFRNRETQKQWPEGAWCNVGDFVRVPKYQGDYWAMQHVFRGKDMQGRDTVDRDFVRFALFKDLAITGVYTTDPLRVRAFL